MVPFGSFLVPGREKILFFPVKAQCVHTPLGSYFLRKQRFWRVFYCPHHIGYAARDALDRGRLALTSIFGKFGGHTNDFDLFLV